MSIWEVRDTSRIAPLFKGWQETMIWSCLQGIMGRAYAKTEENPESAQIVIGDFCFFAGKPDRELVSHRPDARSREFLIMVPENEDWAGLIRKIYGEKAVFRERFAFRKEPDCFDRITLEKFAAGLAEGYELRMVDEEIYRQIMESDWARDLCSQFHSYEDYRKRGIGTAILKEGRIVSGASSYTIYDQGIEIEIDTREDERRKGLALICGAKLILECQKQNRYPSWDAHNMGSVGLAEKLGYHMDRPYQVFEVLG